MRDHKFIEKTLLSLHRQYTENETIQAQAKYISDLKVEAGKTKSYIQELEDERKEYVLNGENIANSKKVKSLKKQIKQLQNKCNKHVTEKMKFITMLNEERKKNYIPTV